jgi:hypothetical protein
LCVSGGELRRVVETECEARLVAVDGRCASARPLTASVPVAEAGRRNRAAASGPCAFRARASTASSNPLAISRRLPETVLSSRLALGGAESTVPGV